MSLHMYIVINKYAIAEYVCAYNVFLAVICVHESENIRDHIHVFDKI